jgi:thioesterase domain-containing protein
LLGGWSLGGAVAFELGRALQAHGRKLAAVIMFDTRMPRTEDRVGEHELVRRFLVDLGGGVAPAGLQGDSPSEILLDGARRAQALPDDSSIEHVRPLFDVFRTNSEALWRYAPEPDALPVTLFRAAVQPDHAGEPGLGWSAIVGPSLQIHDAGGDHYTMFRAPHLAGLAERLREVLATAVATCEV